jgi:hypothetical protein
MKKFMCGLALSLGFLTGAAQAEQMVTVNGTEYPLSALMLTCQKMIDQPEAQSVCFSNLSRLLGQASGTAQTAGASVSEALETLRTAAQYQDDASGLLITGSECSVKVIYFNNYFHISRRNISTIDLFSVELDASKVQVDQFLEVQGAKAPLAKGMMEAGATAVSRGGVELESAQHNFAPRSPRSSLGDYATEVAGILQAREDQAFEFVLIHPNRSQTSAEIWGAFQAYVNACRA